MVSIAHALTGAYLASVCPEPLVYVPLAVASHFILDYVRHYDIGVAMKKYHFGKIQIAIWETLDLAISAALIWWLFHTYPLPYQGHILAGALCGILPDIIETSDYFFNQPLPIFRPFYYFHERFHHSTTHVWWGVWPQLFLICAIVFLTFSR